MLPLDLAPAGKWAGYLVYLLIGMGFGGALEMAGFGDSRKLAAQFYFRDMTVLKTMFTGILTACLLIFLSAALGWLDFSKIFVNQTYLWPGILGGLIMGVGFVIGGYCPGTSVVSAASFKLDGLAFFAGTALGAGLFGEVADSISGFLNSSYTERLLLSDWLGWSIGATVVGVTVLALVFFYAAETVEQGLNGPTPRWSLKPGNRRYLAAGSGALLVALLIWGLGMPSPERKWEKLGAQYQPLLDSREVFVHPLEYVKTWNDASIRLVTLDLRPEAEFKAFHLESAKPVTFEELAGQELVFALDQLPAQGVVVLVADDEAEAVRAWKRLKVQGVTNLYILEHGLTDWRGLFSGLPGEPFDLTRPPAHVLESFPPDAFQTKIKLKTSRRAAGLCS
jgi:rhodanese-related sulfurtransferase